MNKEQEMIFCGMNGWILINTILTIIILWKLFWGGI